MAKIRQWNYARLMCVIDPMGLAGPVEVQVSDHRGDTVLWTLEVLGDGHELHDAVRRLVDLQLEKIRSY